MSHICFKEIDCIYVWLLGTFVLGGDRVWKRMSKLAVLVFIKVPPCHHLVKLRESSVRIVWPWVRISAYPLRMQTLDLGLEEKTESLRV